MAQSGDPFTVVAQNNLNQTFTGCSVGGTATGGDINNGCNWFPDVTGNTLWTEDSGGMVQHLGVYPCFRAGRKELRRAVPVRQRGQELAERAAT